MSDFNGAFDGACAEALKLDTMNLRRFEFYFIQTSCGIAALAQSLQGPCTLKRAS
jgi:hypothetical protein